MKINIAVMFGGESVEHEISIISGIQAMNNFDVEKYNVIPIYVSKDSKWFTGDNLRDIVNYRDLKKISRLSKEVYMKFEKDNNTIYSAKKNKEVTKIDVVFPVFHGGAGEDGKLAGFFDMINIPYASSGYLSSAICIDKEVTKKVLTSSKIEQIEYFTFNFKDFAHNQEEVINKVNEMGYPIIIKPATLGSSIGIAKIENDDEFKEHVFNARKYGNKIIVEKCIENFRELNISLIGDYENQKCSVIEEVKNVNNILTYDDKYKGDENSSGSMESLKREIPAKISKDIEEKVVEISKRAFKALDCSGIVRIDFIIKDEKVYLNEVNTIPGSLSFYLWKHNDVTYKEEIDMLIKLAIKKQREKEKVTTKYSENIISLGYGVKGAKGLKGIKK